MDREFALNPKVPTLISAVELVTALSYVGLAHIDPDLARFLLFLDAHVFGGSSNRKDFAKRLQQALTWIREYTLEGTLPSLPRRAEPPRVLDHGTNGFVLAEVQQGKILEGLVDIYRLGFLRGVLFSPAKEGLDVLAFKKSDYLQFDLETACTRLNQAEQGVGRPPAWALTGLHLRNRSTLMPKDLITQVFLRV
jgi:hypothetical protein